MIDDLYFIGKHPDTLCYRAFIPMPLCRTGGELMSANLGTENYGYMRSEQKASRRKAVGNPQLD